MQERMVFSMFKWISTTTNTPVITIYSNNFTLNSSAASYFENTQWCCVGISKETHQVAIKPISKREVDLEIIPQHQLHKISIGKGYGRISNKEVMAEVAELMKEEGNGQKFMASFDEKEKMLIFDLKVQVGRE